MSMLHDVVVFDRDLIEATTLLNQVKQLINEREIAIKKNKKLINNKSQETVSTSLKHSIFHSQKANANRSIETHCNTACKTRKQNNILRTKQESERRMNTFQILKIQVFQCDKSAFLSQRHDIQQTKYDQETLFKGRSEDIEMQNLVPKNVEEMAQIRKKQKEQLEHELQEVNELTIELLGKQKKAGQMVANSNEKLDDISKKTERVNQKMITMQDKFENLLKTTSNNTLWILIIFNIFLLVFLVCA